MLSMTEILNGLNSDPWMRKAVASLKPNQLEFVLDYLEENKGQSYHDFHHYLNRLFITTSHKLVLNGNEYEYQKVFPNGKKISTAQEIIGSAFNKYYVSGGKVIPKSRNEMLSALSKGIKDKKVDLTLLELVNLNNDDLNNRYEKLCEEHV